MPCCWMVADFPAMLAHTYDCPVEVAIRAVPCPECGSVAGHVCAEDDNPRGEVRPAASHKARRILAATSTT
jgi:hypothetical protein